MLRDNYGDVYKNISLFNFEDYSLMFSSFYSADKFLVIIYYF